MISIPRKLTYGFACLTMAAALTGCQTYGEVSPVAYDYSMALYSITNRKAKAKLQPVSAQIETSRQDGQIRDDEAEWLQEIVAEAKAENWEDANQASRRMMEEQVK